MIMARRRASDMHVCRHHRRHVDANLIWYEQFLKEIYIKAYTAYYKTEI